MYRAIVWKEIREVWWIAGLAFSYLMYLIWQEAGPPGLIDALQLPWSSYGVGRDLIFPYSSVVQALPLIGGVVGAAIGLWQSLGEELRGSWVYLRFRPLSSKTILWLKLGVGLSLVLLTTGLPALIRAIWGATPGDAAAPFYWWMTATAWKLCAAGTCAYLAGFLSGMRPARWYGSRHWPLVLAAVLSLLLASGDLHKIGWLLIILLDSVLLIAIFDAARTRDLG